MSNKEVLRIKEIKRMLILRIKKRKLKFLGQRKQGLVLLVCFVLRHINLIGLFNADKIFRIRSYE